MKMKERTNKSELKTSVFPIELHIARSWSLHCSALCDLLFSMQGMRTPGLKYHLIHFYMSLPPSSLRKSVWILLLTIQQPCWVGYSGTQQSRTVSKLHSWAGIWIWISSLSVQHSNLYTTPALFMPWFVAHGLPNLSAGWSSFSQISGPGDCVKEQQISSYFEYYTVSPFAYQKVLGLPCSA